MEKHTLKAEIRKVTGRKVKKLRSQGVVPANIFGKSVTSQSIQVNAIEFAKAFAKVGESTLLYVQIEGDKEEHPVLVREVTRNPVTEKVLHVDFNQVSLKEKITAPVAIKVVGEPIAEKEKLGILVQQLHEVEVEALPTDMPEHLEVDVANLANVDESIYVKDLQVDTNKVSIKTDPESIVVKIEKLAEEEKVEVPVAAEGEVVAEGAEAAPVAEGEASTQATEEKAGE